MRHATLRMCGVLSFVVCIAAIGAQNAAADYQVSGRFQYTDRDYTLGGFTGNFPNLPIREADVEVIDADNLQVLATGATDNDGFFAIQVVDDQTRNVTVRALTSSNYTPTLHMKVINNLGAVYAVAHPVFISHDPGSNIDFTGAPIVAPPSSVGNTQPGDPFNIFDVTLDALNFFATLHGSRPGAADALTLRWYMFANDGTNYGNTPPLISLYGLSGDSDGYDDSVIQHEVGHYVEFRFADSDNPAWSHSLTQCYPQTLSWSEGWSTFFQNMVRRYVGLPRPDIYVDTTGWATTGGAFISYSVETLTFANLDAGSGNEASVNAALWDFVDGPATDDATPGSDDDSIDIADGPARAWDVHSNYLPTVSPIQIERFWDGWFLRGHGEATGMQNAFAVYKMQFYDDAFEPDDSVGQARDGGIADETTQHTLYGVGDADWTRFDGVNGGSYSFTITTPLACGVNTVMELYDSNGTTLLSTNSTTINWQANKNGALYLRVVRPGPDTYGNYELTVDINVPVTLTDVSLRESDAGVELSWQAQAEGAFSHFLVQRSADANGPYVQRNAEPLGESPDGRYTFVDTDVESGRSWWYRILGVEETGESEVFGPWEITLQSTVPARLRLHAARPNPFNPNTVLAFDLPQAGRTFLRVYSIDGRLVRTLVDGRVLEAGTRQVTWDGRTDAGQAAASGVYIVHLDSQGRSDRQRAVLVR